MLWKKTGNGMINRRGGGESGGFLCINVKILFVHYLIMGVSNAYVFIV